MKYTLALKIAVILTLMVAILCCAPNRGVLREGDGPKLTYATTEDGSYGREGRVSDVLRELINEGQKIDILRQPFEA